MAEATNQPAAAPDTPRPPLPAETVPVVPQPAMSPVPATVPQQPAVAPQSQLPEVSKQALLAAKGDKVDDFDRLLKQHDHQQFIELVRTMSEQEKGKALEITRGLRRVLRARYEEIQKLDQRTRDQLQGLKEHVEPVVAASAIRQDVQDTAAEIAKPIGGFFAGAMEKAKGWSRSLSGAMDRVPGGGRLKSGVKWLIEMIGDVVEDVKYAFGTSIPERTQQLGHFFASWGTKVWYGMLASPTFLSGALPFGSSLLPAFSEKARDQLARIAAVESIESAIAAERTTKPIDVTFDSNEMKAKWVNIPADKKAKEYWRAQTVALITAARTRGDAKVVITVDALLNPEQRQKLAEQETTKQRTEKLQKAWNLPDAVVKFEGDRAKAKKDTAGKWTILFPKADALSAEGEPVTAEAKLLRDALQALPSTQEVEVGGKNWDLRRGETGGVLAALPASIDRTLLPQIETLAKGFKGWTRAKAIHLDDSGLMKPGQPLVTFAIENSLGVLKFNDQTELSTLPFFFAQADAVGADIGTTWAWTETNGTKKWNVIPFKTA